MESTNTHRNLIQKGFTLIELLVVLAIIIVITTIALTSQSTFNKTLILTNTAYDIALTIRSAETYGLGSKAVGAVANIGYGVDFQKGTPATFTLFSDTYPAAGIGACHPTLDATAPDAEPGDCVYQAAQSEKVLGYTLGNGVTISNFCAFIAGGWVCSSGTLTSLDISFARPNPVAFISTNGVYSVATPASAACITVSQGGNSRYIAVNAAGRITGNATSCP